MGVKVRIPTPLRKVTEGMDTVEVNANTVGECIDSLETRFPGVKSRLCNQEGQLHRFVNVYLNGEDVRFLEGLATAVKPGDEVSIVPAVAGG